MRRFAAILALGLLTGPALAQERVPVRVGEHPDHGRIVFDWPQPPAYTVEQQGERVLLRFAEAGRIDLPAVRRLPRNMIAAELIEGGVALTLRPGARIRHFRNGPRVALDAFDPPRPEAAPRPAVAAAPRPNALAGAAQAPVSTPARAQPEPPLPSQASGTPPARAQPETPLPSQASGTPSAEAAPSREAPPLVARATPHLEPMAVETPPRPAGAPAVPAMPAAVPRPGLPTPASTSLPNRTNSAATSPAPEAAGLRVRLASQPGAPLELRLGFSGDVAAAALLRGDILILAFDAERNLDLAGLRADPALSRSTTHRVPGGVILALPAQGPVELRREASDWVIVGVATPAPAQALGPSPVADLAEFAARRPGHVLGWVDPQTGLPMLIGTVAEPGQRQVVARSFAAFELPETLLGLAILARSDGVSIRNAAGRFLLAVDGTSAVAQTVPGPAAAAAGMSRSFDFPALPIPALAERLRVQQTAIAAAPPLARGPLRRAAAETLLALGLPQEAQAMLQLAAREDPLSQQDPRHGVLGAMAALLAGRAVEGQALDASLPLTDELMLWRAVRDAAQDQPRSAAPGFAVTLPLILAYPEGLRRRLLPIAAEAMAEGGEAAAARRLIEAAQDDVPLSLALGMAEEAAGEADRALEAYAAAAQGQDRLSRARALRRATELRLAAGRLDPAGAAQALEQAMFAWRGDEQEIALRERIAELRRAAGDPRAALALLRETEAMFPERAATLRSPIQESFLAALEVEPPLAAVALHDSLGELMPGGERGEAALAALAERLAALDLADRAATLLRRGMERAPPGPQRAALGLRLAQQRLSERDTEGALAALGASGAPHLPSPLTTARSITAARAEAQRGNRSLAAEALAALGAAGDEALAEILADARDFPGAAAALGRHLIATLPVGSEVLTEPQQRMVLRQAALLALTGDGAGLNTLKRDYGGRLTHRQIASAFEALTADPVRGLADLPRVIRELDLFRSLPNSREPLRTARAAAG
jgi:hypothetical protein